METNPFDKETTLLDHQCAEFSKFVMAVVSASGVAFMSVMAAIESGLIHFD